MVSKKARYRWLFGTGGLFVVALLLLTFRSAWSGGSSSAASFADVVDYPPEFQAGSFEYTLRPDAQGADYVVTAISESVRAQAVAAGLNIDVADALERILARRTRLLLAPNYEAWLAMSGTSVPPEADPHHPEHAQFMAGWERAAALFRHSPVAGQHVQFRLIEPVQEPLTDVVAGLYLRGGGPGGPAMRYPDPPAGDPTITAVEVLIPMQYLPPLGGDTLPVTVSMRFWRSAGTPEWQPTDLYLYFDYHAYGVGLADPIW